VYTLSGTLYGYRRADLGTPHIFSSRPSQRDSHFCWIYSS